MIIANYLHKALQTAVHCKISVAQFRSSQSLCKMDQIKINVMYPMLLSIIYLFWRYLTVTIKEAL